MSSLTAAAVMSTAFLRREAHIPLSHLQAQLTSTRAEAVLILGKKGQIRGLLSRERILAARSEQPLPISKVFSLSRPVTIGPDFSLAKILAFFNQQHPGLVVVDENQNPLGVITWEILTTGIIRGWLKSQAILDTLLNHASEAICIINEREEVEYWNPRAEILYGIKAREILGQPVSKFFPNVLVSHSLKENKVIRESYHQPREDAHVLITAAPIQCENRVIGSLSLERDIGDIVYLNQELTRTSTTVKKLRKEINRLSQKNAFATIYGHSTIIKETINLAKKFAATDASLLIRGESGTGKELFARAIHEESKRYNQPFIAVNCGALPSLLFESELFGYESGAFTGAERGGKPGKFELAEGGTLFLDEIGELELSLQAKLLRALQEKVFYRVGGTKPIKVNVRIIAATNRDLEKMIREGTFREDLYYRLNVLTLTLPPLREHKEDLPELAYLLVQELASIHQKRIQEIEPEVMVAFMNYHWPGNVRELRNTLERMVILSDDGILRQDTLPAHLRLEKLKELRLPDNDTSGPLPEVTIATEKRLIAEALKKANYNKAEAARLLGIPRSSLYYKMKVLGLTPDN
ncbi:PAS domain S-box-containing protein [Carboxydocella sporoproducens DSM 16521]|uniref:PAS domain S-box-containing protein n=2 Tax=Carboxydocella TaxID=178898 RepID=A0A1T4QPV1_9FIRM|nr:MULTISPECIES: sigma 54-interacting transcriptional regulator [Carboxydocella]AVX21537.1 PAS domain S-box-containing protein [Carboxydocella thermautotrophica]AVX32018.1 PAS domain S-box-containing protein [Carboxydocella thermautotrophica]GAW27750.1 hypothetical protein ULO1_03200 [Carboxydocella sp. ULO1]SKA05725.1 PAS domain S-box-containing protein [Carboxydocella sporoproducens DSM 16521]